MALGSDKRSRNARVFLATAAVLVAVAGAALFSWGEYHRSVTVAEVPEVHAKLMNYIESYWSVSELESYFESNSIAWEVKRGKPPNPKDKRPPFTVDTVTVNNYAHLGFAGKLVVEFFNGRLVATKFWPIDVDGYLARLSRIVKLDPDNRQAVEPWEYSRVWVAIDYRGGRYIGWEDVRLASAMRLWIKRYS